MIPLAIAGHVPSAELTQQWKMAIEIVDFPSKNGDFPLLFVCSPEGIYGGFHKWRYPLQSLDGL